MEMTPEQIREVVKMTLDELSKRKLLDDSKVNRNVASKALRSYFGKGSVKNGKRITYILQQLSDDPYIDILYLNYRDGRTIEWIAEHMEKDESTIKRNRKRLLMEVHRMLET